MDGQFAKMIPKRTEIDWRPQSPAGDRKARAGNALRFCLLNVEWEAGTCVTCVKHQPLASFSLH